MSDIAEVLANALGEKADYFEPPDRPWGDEDEIGRIRTKPGYIFDDDFWDVFHALDLHVCHVAYYGPKRREDADRRKDKGIFELRYTWRRAQAMGRSARLARANHADECGCPDDPPDAYFREAERMLGESA